VVGVLWFHAWPTWVTATAYAPTAADILLSVLAEEDVGPRRNDSTALKTRHSANITVT